MNVSFIESANNVPVAETFSDTDLPDKSTAVKFELSELPFNNGLAEHCQIGSSNEIHTSLVLLAGNR